MSVRKFNNLFKNDDEIQEAMDFVLNGTLPERLVEHYSRTLNRDVTKMITKKMKKKFDGFKVKNDILIYEPLDLYVVPYSQKELVLKTEYDKKEVGGKGKTSFYKYITNNYINLTREDVNEFLDRQPEYMMTRNIKAKVNKPIVSKFPNQTYALDLIDMVTFNHQNKGNNYILTIVDVFSRKVWLYALKNKESKSIVDALNKLIKKIKIKPASIQTDNGTEFMGEFTQFLESKGIKQRFSQTYNPRANGIVENKNGQIRKLLRFQMLKRNSLVWYDLLDEIAENLNNTYNSSIKATANEVWSREKYENIDLDEVNVSKKRLKQYQAQEAVEKRIEKQIDEYKEQDNFEVGDAVRVKMSALFSKVRKLIKEKKTKLIVVTFCPKIFYVYRIIVPRRHNPLERKRYLLKDEDGNLLLHGGVSKLKEKIFYASDMIKVDKNDKDAMKEPISVKDALVLNGVSATENDVIIYE
jgi:transposase InsO family protein